MKFPPIHFVCASDPARHAPHDLMPAFHLAQRGHEVECICQGRPEIKEHVSPLGRLCVTSLRGYRSRAGGGWFQLRLFWQILKRRFFSRTHLFYIYSSCVTPASWLALLGLDPSRVVYHTQEFLEPGRHSLWSFFERRIARRAGHVFCNEINRARCLASLYQLPSRPTVISTRLPGTWPAPAFDLSLRSRLVAQSGYGDGGRVRLIMNLGGFSPVRCSAALVEAVSLLPENYLLIMSASPPAEGSVREGRKLLRQLKIEHRAVLLDFLPFAEVLRHCAACDIGVLLYPDDGIGNFYQSPGRLTEYLCAGIPVVASDFPGLSLLVRRHALGEVCDPESPLEIARALRRLGDLPSAQRAGQRERLRAVARAELSYETEADRIGEAIDRLRQPLPSLAPAGLPVAPCQTPV